MTLRLARSFTDQVSGSLLAAALLFAVPTYLQLNDSFRPVEKRVEVSTSGASAVPLEIEAPGDPYYFEVDLSVSGTGRAPSEVQILVNGNPVRQIDVVQQFATHREKFLVEPSVFRRGGNEFLVSISSAEERTVSLRARVQNYYGISPRFPRGYVVSDDSLRLFLANASWPSEGPRLLAVVVACFVFMWAFAAALRATTGPRGSLALFLFLLPPALLPWGTLLFSVATSYHVWFPFQSILGAGAILALFSLAASLLMRHKATVGRVAGVLLVTALLAEGTFRIYNRVHPTFVFYQDSYNRFRGDPFAPFFDSRLNSAGFNDLDHSTEKTAGVFRIVALGDSFAHGIVPYRHNFLTLLEERLNQDGFPAEVFNMGIAGLTPEDYLSLLVTEGLAYAPDLVLVCFFVGNDFEEPAKTLADYSHLASFLRFAVGLTRTSEESLPLAAGGATEPEVYFDDEPSRDVASFMAIETERSRIYLRDNAEFPGQTDRTVRHLARIHEVARRAGAGLLVILIPDEAQVDGELQARILESYGWPPPALDFAQPNDALSPRLEELGISSLDLLPFFIEGAGRERLYKPRDTHWNIAGNRLAADQIAEYVLRQVRPR